MKRRLCSFMSLVLSLTLVFGVLTVWKTPPVEAKATRLAIVTDVGGTVSVKSAGGSKSYEAYTDMALNEGDYITTEEDSYLVVKIKDTEDELTIGANAEVYISDLAGKGSGKKSKLKMWAGSVWTSVKKLAGVDDFEVETPTAVMGVRGTNVLTTVDPATGLTTISVVSGFVKAQSLDEQGGAVAGDNRQVVFIYPTQQIGLETYDDAGNLQNFVEMVDPSQLIHNLSPQIIEAIVRSLAYVNQEHDEFIARKKEELAGQRDGNEQGSLVISSLDDLNRVNQNFNNLIGNIVKSAIRSGTVNEAEIRKVIDEANQEEKDPARRLYLDDVKPLDRTAGVDAEREKARLAELEKLNKLKEEKLKEAKAAEDAAKLKLQQTLKQLELEKKRIQEENEKKLKEEKEKAEQAYLNQLSQAEKEKFLQAQQKNTPSPTASPSPTPTSTSAPGSGTIRVTGVTITTSASPSISVNGTVDLNWSVQPANASNKKVIWTSSNSAIAEISQNGRVTGKAPGTATMTVTTEDGAFAKSISVTVVQQTVPVTGVTVSGPSQSPNVLLPGDTVQLTASVAPANATNHAVTWSSANPLVATVDSTGLVTAVSNGQTTITATTADGHFTSAYTVKAAYSAARGPFTGVIENANANGYSDGQTFNLRIEGSHVNDIYGIQIEVPNTLYSTGYNSVYLSPAGGANGKPSSDMFTIAESASSFHETASSIIFAAQFDDRQNRSVTANALFAKLPFRLSINNVAQTLSFTVKVKLVDKEGKSVAEQSIPLTIKVR